MALDLITEILIENGEKNLQRSAIEQLLTLYGANLNASDLRSRKSEYTKNK